MRIFEILLLIALLLALANIPRDKSRGIAFVALSVIFALAHIVWEGTRWQMAPAYGVAGCLLAWVVGQRRPGARQSGRPQARRVLLGAGIVLGGLAVLAAAGLSVVFPVFKLPTPTGPYAIGTTSFALVDTSRPEALTPAPDDFRELLVRVWYPAEPQPGAQPAPYWERPDIYGPLLADFLSLPPVPDFFFAYIDLVATHAFPDAPLAGGGAFPVLVYSHGYGGLVSQNTVLLEELASHGYVVFSIAHPHEALAVVFPDGRVVARSPDLIFSPFDRTWRDWAADTRFVMDALEGMNAGAPGGRFTGRLDMGQLGVLGMSYGGAAAGLVCVTDARCQAGLNLDGVQFDDLMGETLDKPFLMFYSEQNEGINDPVYAGARGPFYRVVVEGSTHFNFSDLSLSSPLMQPLGLLGSIDRQRSLQIANDYVRAFFDQHLKGVGEGMLALDEPGVRVDE